MPISMKFPDWKDRTSRGLFTPRSGLLEKIDIAFKAYDAAVKTNQGTTKASVTLFDALLAWIAKKGPSWKSSTRNSKIEVGGKGTVETLLNQLIAAYPQFAMKAAPYLAKPAAKVPTVLLELGKKNDQKDLDGDWHSIPIQSKDNSCGPCSVRLVAKLVHNLDIGEDYLRELVESAEEGGAYAGTLGVTGIVGEGGAHDWSPNGNGTWLVPAVFGALRPSIAVENSTDPNVLLKATKKKPAVAVVEWTSSGGLHYVVVLGKNRAGDSLIILDPFYGVQSAPITGNAPGVYSPVDPNTKAVLSTARWYNWVCAVA